MTSDVLQLQALTETELRIPAPLHEYQWEGVSFLYRSKSALLADEMGLGKTVQAAVALALLINESNDIRRALIVAPSSLMTNWMSELETWAPSLTTRQVQGTARDREAFYLLPIPVLVSSYEQIRHDGLDRIPSNTFDLVILDEAQRIKNRNSSTALACKLLPRKRAWALSATPLENDVDDVVSILGFLDPSIERNLPHARLAERLESFMLRRLKEQVRADLPPVIVQDLLLDLSRQQKTRYDELWVHRTEAIGGSAEGGDISTVLLGLITRLKIVCNYDEFKNVSSKFDALETIIDGAGSTARILVFSQFVETLRWISGRVSLAHDLLIGSMSLMERDAAIENFKKREAPRLLLISLRAGGVGLNLGEATHVVLFDRWWNPAVEVQAIYRAHRFERKEPLHVIRFLVNNTIEERIAEVLTEKEDLFDEVVESSPATTHRLTKKELMRILEITDTNVLGITHNIEGDENHGKNH